MLLISHFIHRENLHDRAVAMYRRQYSVVVLKKNGMRKIHRRGGAESEKFLPKKKEKEPIINHPSANR